MGSKVLAAATAEAEALASVPLSLVKEVALVAVSAVQVEVEDLVEAIKGDGPLVHEILDDLLVSGISGNTELSSELQAQLRSLAAKTKKKAAQAVLDSMLSSASVAIKILGKVAGTL